MITESCPEAHGGLSGELHFLDAKQTSIFVERVVDVGEVQKGRTLSHAAELVVDGAVADADPSVVGAQIGNGNTAQMGANS